MDFLDFIRKNQAERKQRRLALVRKAREEQQDVEKGGPGSGNWGHAGREGKRGGSMPRSKAMSVRTGKDWKKRQAEAKGKKGARTATQKLTNDIVSGKSGALDKLPFGAREQARKLVGSITEGERRIKTGKDALGRKLSQGNIDSTKRAIEYSKAKLSELVTISMEGKGTKGKAGKGKEGPKKMTPAQLKKLATARGATKGAKYIEPPVSIERGKPTVYELGRKGIIAAWKHPHSHRKEDGLSNVMQGGDGKFYAFRGNRIFEVIPTEMSGDKIVSYGKFSDYI